MSSCYDFVITFFFEFRDRFTVSISGIVKYTVLAPLELFHSVSGESPVCFDLDLHRHVHAVLA